MTPDRPGPRPTDYRLLRPITPGGWLAIMLASVLAAIAMRAYNPWLLLVACGLASPVILAQFLRPDLDAVTVTFRSPKRLIAGEETEQVLTIHNHGGRSLPGIGVFHLCPGLAPVVLSVPPLGPGCEAEFVLDRLAVRRGRTDFHEVRLGTTAPFGMAHHTRRIRTRGAELVVHPARVPAAGLVSSRITPEDVGGARPLRSGSEPHGLREWRHGDERRHVNWRATARSTRPEQLIVVVPEPEVENRLMLVVTGAAEDEAWEDLVRLAAWSARAAASDHADVTLIAPGVPPWTGTDELEILDWFSALTGEGSAPDDTHAPDGVDVAHFQQDVRERTAPGMVVIEATTRPFGLHPVPVGTLLRGMAVRAAGGTEIGEGPQAPEGAA